MLVLSGIQIETKRSLDNYSGICVFYDNGESQFWGNLFQTWISRIHTLNISYFQTKMVRTYTLFQTKMAEKPYPLAQSIAIQLTDIGAADCV